MPWVRKSPRYSRVNWIIGIMGGMIIGLLLGYERWGSTAAVVSIVEKELNTTEARITDAENRLIRLESKVLRQENGHPAMESMGSAIEGKNGVTQASTRSANYPTAPTDTY
jgi:hypothetical protein